MDEDYPLHLAAEFGNYDKVQFLLKTVKNINEEDNNCYTPLQRAIQNGETAIVKLLIKHGADVDYAAGHVLHPIHLAASFGHLDIFKILVDKGVPINRLSYDGDLPLHWASSEGHLDIVEYILNRRQEDIDVPNCFTNTSLHLAASCGWPQIVKLLISRNARDLPNVYNFYPLHSAIEGSHFEVLRIFIENGAELDENCVRLASSRGNLRIVQFLIGRGVPCKLTGTSEGLSVLHEATKSGNLKLVKYLLKKGADVNIPTRSGYIPLHVATESGDYKMVKLLVNNGAEVNFKTYPKGFAALHFAVRNCFPNITEFLIQRGATFTESELLQIISRRFYEVDVEWERRYQHTAKIVIKYILLFNRNIRLSFPFDTQLTCFWLECLKEIDDMDNCLFENTTISLFKFLQSIFFECRLARYLNNDDLLNELSRVDEYLKKFPIYKNLGDFIDMGLKKGFSRQRLLEQCELIFGRYCPRLPTESKHKIFGYLSTEDLNNFLKSDSVELSSKE